MEAKNIINKNKLISNNPNISEQQINKDEVKKN